MTACDSDETAKEKLKIGNGIFTHSFVEVLGSEEYEKYAPFEDAYNKISLKVKEETENEQNPQSKCDGESFTIPVVPKENQEIDKEVKLDLSIIPKPKQSQIKNMDKFEENIIFLIQNNRDIELDKLLKKSISEAYVSIGELIAPPHKLDKASVISSYEACRKQIKPLILIFDYLLKYGKDKYVLDNLDLIFSFENLSKNMSGLTVMIRMPSILISEIIINILGPAYKNRNLGLLKKLFTPGSAYFRGKSIPFILDSRVWYPEIFHNNVQDYFKYLYPEDPIKRDILLQQEIYSLCEINFLIDAYSLSNAEYTCFPLYTIYNNEIPQIILSKLKDENFMDFMTSLLNISKNELIDLITKRIEEVKSWGGGAGSDLYFIQEDIIKKFEDLKGN